MTKSLTGYIQALLTASVDAENGYLEAIKDAENPEDLTSLFERMALLHQGNASELSRVLVGMNVVPDMKASIMSVIHKTIMDVRSLVGGLDKSVLPGLIDGEERNEKLFKDAIVAANDQPSVQGMLDAQAERLSDAIADMRKMPHA